jgi:hypothetical protein
MAYSAPTWSAVDFTGTGVVVSAPQWDQVDFITPPATLLRGAVVASSTVTGSINHQVLFGAVSAQSSLSGTVTQLPKSCNR